MHLELLFGETEKHFLRRETGMGAVEKDVFLILNIIM